VPLPTAIEADFAGFGNANRGHPAADVEPGFEFVIKTMLK